MLQTIVLFLVGIVVSGCTCDGANVAAGDGSVGDGTVQDGTLRDGSGDVAADARSEAGNCSLSCPNGEVCVVNAGVPMCAGPCADTRCGQTDRCGVACIPYHEVGSCRGVTCAANQTCFNGRCVAGCYRNPCLAIAGSCPDGSVCAEMAGGAACIARTELSRFPGLCPAGTIPQGRCVPASNCPPCGAGERCTQGQCVRDPCVGVNCPAGSYCVEGVCRDSCECTAPNPSACQCPQGTRWDGTRCASLPCERNCPANNTTAGLNDGCGGTCPVACTPNCPGDGSRSCMNNGCGGACPCANGQVCSGTSCCTPTCGAGQACQADGCGGMCPCAGGGICRSGQCCTPNCAGNRGCQSDGCGGVCACPLGQSCNANGMCSDPPGCPQACPDGRPPCGCSCCATGETCEGGACVPFIP